MFRHLATFASRVWVDVCLKRRNPGDILRGQQPRRGSAGIHPRQKEKTCLTGFLWIRTVYIWTHRVLVFSITPSPSNSCGCVVLPSGPAPAFGASYRSVPDKIIRADSMLYTVQAEIGNRSAEHRLSLGRSMSEHEDCLGTLVNLCCPRQVTLFRYIPKIGETAPATTENFIVHN